MSGSKPRRSSGPDKRRCPASGKWCYPTRKDAAFVAAKVRRTAGEPVMYYKCPDCGDYHIGHPNTADGWRAARRRMDP